MLVCCVKVVNLYGPEYVNRLASMVARHTTQPYYFVCLTDDPSGLEVPSWPIETDLPGWWAKLVLFKPTESYERILYLDLDTVIVGNIDFLFEYRGPFAILRSFWGPSRYGSAIMSIAPGVGPEIWTDFTMPVMSTFHGDQDWIEAKLLKAPDFWQDVAPGKIGSYKADRLQDGPRDFAVCCFHGKPKPHEVDGWVKDAWR